LSHHHRPNGADRSSAPSGHATTVASGPAALRPVAGGDADGEVESPRTDRRSYPGGFRNPYAS
jgi:hypothetical protein